MSGASAARAALRFVWLVLLSSALGSLVTSRVVAFEAFDGRLQAHGFYESQLRVMNADYSEDWDVTQWYQVFNLELEFDLIDETVGIFDLLSAYVRAEVRYDCIYSRGCGMFRSMNTYGDRSKSLPRRLSNAETVTASGELIIRNDGRVTGSTTDPVALADVAGFDGISDTEGQPIEGTATPCGPGDTPGVDCFPVIQDTDDLQRMGDLGGARGFAAGQKGIMPFDYVFERFSDFRFSMVNVKGGAGSGLPLQILGPWLPKNFVSTNATMADRVNPFDSSRVNPVLNCNQIRFAVPLQPEHFCSSAGRRQGSGARPFRPIPIFAEDFSRPGPEKIRVVVYRDETGLSLDPATGGNGADPSVASDFQILEIDTAFNHGDVRFNGTLSRWVQLNVSFPGDLPTQGPRTAFDARDLQRNPLPPYDGTGLQNLNLTPNPNWRIINSADGQLDTRAGRQTQVFLPPGQSAPNPWDARGLFVPSKPLRRAMQSGKLGSSWPLNVSENERAWNRGLAQQDEKELKEAYFDIEMFDSQLWLRIGKQQIVWGKTELFRTTDQFNPQDLALATLPSLEESRIGLWSVRGVWSFYEVGPLEDVRLELAANIDDYESSDFGSCGEPYVVNLVCAANFGAFAHGFAGIGIVGIESPPDPWQSLKGWEIGARIEWRWDRFSFALSDFWGYADLPTVNRISTYERNVDSQTGRPLVYQGGQSPDDRRPGRHPSFARDTDPLWGGVGRGDDPWQDPYDDLVALIAAQTADPGGTMGVPQRLPTGLQVKAFFPGAPVIADSFRDANDMVVRSGRVNCGSSKAGSDALRFSTPQVRVDEQQLPSDQGELDPGVDCLTAGPTQLYTDPSFDQAGDRSSDRFLADPTDPGYLATNALDSHHANLTIFTWVCASTIGFLDLDPTACAQTVFGSEASIVGEFNVAQAIGRALGGNAWINALFASDAQQTCLTPKNCPFERSNKGSGFLPVGMGMPIVQLSNDPNDLDSLDCIDFRRAELALAADRIPCGGFDSFSLRKNYLGAVLSPEQEALLGCGPFWGTSCDDSGIDLLNMEPSIVLQAFAGASGTLEALRLKEQGISPEGTSIIDPVTGQVQAFRAPTEYRTDEGLQPGTLPWEVAGIGGPLCSTADIGGDLYPRGQDTISVPDQAGGSNVAARPPSRKQALPGCHRKWVDKQNGYLNLAWGQPYFRVDVPTGNLVPNPATSPGCLARGDCLPTQYRDNSQDVVVAYQYYSGDPDPLGVYPDNQFSGTALKFPDSVLLNSYVTAPIGVPVFSINRPAVGTGHPFASRRAQGLRTEDLIVPFATELAGLSWNFQMISVAFSSEFQNGLETVGDLADPFSAKIEGGSFIARDVPQDEDASDPTAFLTIEGNKRRVAQYLFAYCGSDYGTKLGLASDGVTPQGTCNISAQTNSLPALTELFVGLQATTSFDPTDPDERQALFDSLMFVDVALVEAEDATSDSDETEVNRPVTGENNILLSAHCSYITPQYCSTVQGLFSLAGLKRNTLAAGGNGTYGRRTLQWHSGGEITLLFPKRNVLGFALDFAEDRTKSNFSIETTWIENVPTGDNEAWGGSRRTDEFNMTVSVDRPTFINFLNPNRTLFINSQWFFQYRRGVKKSFGGNGPFNALATLTVFTGYFQDRLNPSVTFVHDIQSASGGLLPSINYRFNENFSATLGMAFFYGREQRAPISTNGIGPASNQQGDWAYESGAQNGISIVRDRDEAFLRIRYTF